MSCPRTGPQAAARQPRGFAPGLTLKQHQLEALSLMQAAEQRPLGFNSVVWKEVTLGGRRWWLSPLLGKMSSEAPPKQATGGILGGCSFGCLASSVYVYYYVGALLFLPCGMCCVYALQPPRMTRPTTAVSQCFSSRLQPLHI